MKRWGQQNGNQLAAISVNATQGVKDESLGKIVESTQAQGSERGDVMKYSL